MTPEAKRILEALANSERYEIMVVLKQHNEGLSFSQLADSFAQNHNTLDRHLKVLTQATIIWNFYERREGREYSFYKLSELGKRLLASLQDEIVLTA